MALWYKKKIMETEERANYTCPACYGLFKNGEEIIRQLRYKKGDLLFHPGCIEQERDEKYMHIYTGKGTTRKVLIVPEENFQRTE